MEINYLFLRVRHTTIHFLTGGITMIDDRRLFFDKMFPDNHCLNYSLYEMFKSIINMLDVSLTIFYYNEYPETLICVTLVRATAHVENTTGMILLGAVVVFRSGSCGRDSSPLRKPDDGCG